MFGEAPGEASPPPPAPRLWIPSGWSRARRSCRQYLGGPLFCGGAGGAVLSVSCPPGPCGGGNFIYLREKVRAGRGWGGGGGGRGTADSLLSAEPSTVVLDSRTLRSLPELKSEPPRRHPQPEFHSLSGSQAL